MAVAEGEANGGASAPPGGLVRWLLVGRAVVVLSLGVAFLVSGDNRPVLGNLLSTYWLAGAVVTLVWVRTNWGSRGSRLGLLAGLAGVVAAVIGLSRFLIQGAVSADGALALLGATAVVVGGLRLMGAFHDDAAERPRLSRRLVLGLGEIVVGVVWIATDDVTSTVTTSAAAWALVGGSIMLIDALSIRGVERGPASA